MTDFSEAQSPGATLGDAQLVALCRTGDQAAWRELVERFSRYVYAITSRGFSLSDDVAEDVFQDVFARVYENLDKLSDDAAIRPWIAQTTRRLAIDALRAGARVEPTEDEVLTAGLVADDEIGELDTAMDLRAAMSRLPEYCNEILDRFFARDETYNQIGDALDIPPGTIASRISRCLKKLREDFGKKVAA